MTQEQFEKFKFRLSQLKDKFLLADNHIIKILGYKWNPPITTETIKKGFFGKERKITRTTEGKVTIYYLRSEMVGTDYNGYEELYLETLLFLWLDKAKELNGNYNSLINELQIFGLIEIIKR